MNLFRDLFGGGESRPEDSGEEPGHDRKDLEAVIVRIAGDSGDGIQVVGGQLGLVNALQGSDLATFPDFPSEVRAPVGTTYGVSAFQIQFGSRDIRTIGDEPDVLVALNPAALKTNIGRLRDGGLIIVDEGAFGERNLQKAGYETSPLSDGSLNGYKIIAPDISKMTMAAVSDIGLNKKASLRCKNFYALGFVYWLFGRKRQPTRDWLIKKFPMELEIADANIAALDAGHAYGETMEASGELAGFVISKAEMEPGLYRLALGSQSMAWGLAAAAELSNRKLVFASYPITPASPVLHELAKLKDLGVVTFQAEDEIAAICAAIGASYGGALGVTSSSGPGIALKAEAMSLAVSIELPLVVVNTQRAGPSTGMPTKTEQSDLYQAVYGRHGESPLPVIAARSPADCFETAIEACRIAMTYMTPVILLSDGFIGNASEPWLIPDLEKYASLATEVPVIGENFEPFARDPNTLARPWVIPGIKGAEHRIGGIEKDYHTGDISYDPANHQKMTDMRADKVSRIGRHVPPLVPDQGEASGDLAIVGWGSTYGPISRAVTNLRAAGHKVSHIHLRYLYPFAANQHELLSGFKNILVPEMNSGQLLTLMRAGGCPKAEGLNKVTGQPFLVREIEAAAKAQLEQHLGAPK